MRIQLSGRKLNKKNHQMSGKRIWRPKVGNGNFANGIPPLESTGLARHLAHCIYLWQHIINYGHRKLHFCLRRIFILLRDESSMREPTS